MLLSRAAESLYWFARYLERAEDTARILREHTNLMVDLPTIVPITWKPLLAISGDSAAFVSKYQRDDESAIMHYLIADKGNASSIVAAVSQSRENLRVVRELVPSELWQSVNDLYLFVAGNHAEGVARASRRRFLDRVITESQLCSGIVAGTMSRSEAHSLLSIGMFIERADMTTRVIDVNAATVGAQGEQALHGDVQWSSVLRSLAGLQMYRRATQSTASGAAVVRFLLADREFPRSFAYCTGQLAQLLAPLPGGEPLAAAAARLSNDAAGTEFTEFDVDEVRKVVDQLQRALSLVGVDVSRQYFDHGVCG